MSRESDELIGFVKSSFLSSAITMKEVRDWALHMIDKHDVDDLPLYIFDLLDFDDSVLKFEKVIGFFSGWNSTKAEDLALGGIGIARGFERFEPIPPKGIFLKKLKANPHVFQRFKETFPFIDVSEVEKFLASED